MARAEGVRCADCGVRGEGDFAGLILRRPSSLQPRSRRPGTRFARSIGYARLRERPRASHEQTNPGLGGVKSRVRLLAVLDSGGTDRGQNYLFQFVPSNRRAPSPNYRRYITLRGQKNSRPGPPNRLDSDIYMCILYANANRYAPAVRSLKIRPPASGTILLCRLTAAVLAANRSGAPKRLSISAH